MYYEHIRIYIMKAKTFALVLFAFCLVPIYAAKKPVFSFGLYAGFNASSLYNSEVPSHDYNFDLVGVNTPYKTYMPNRILRDSLGAIGYPYGSKPFDYETSFFKDMVFNIAAGIYVDIPLKRNLSLKLYGSYEKKGKSLENERVVTEKTDENEVTTTTLYRRNVNNTYLVVPLLLKYAWPNRTTYFIQGGPYAGFLMKSNTIGSSIVTELSGNSALTEAYDFDADSKDHTNGVDYGLMVGGGMEFYWTSNSYIFLEMNAGLGLRKIDKLYNNGYEEFETSYKYLTNYTSQNYYSLNSNAKNFSVMFTIGFRYSVYKK